MMFGDIDAWCSCYPMPNPMPTNPITGTDRQTTLEDDLERARRYRLWLGVAWVLEVGDLAYVCGKSFRSTLIDVSCENTDKTDGSPKPRHVCHTQADSADEKTRT